MSQIWLSDSSWKNLRPDLIYIIACMRLNKEREYNTYSALAPIIRDGEKRFTIEVHLSSL